MKAGRAMWGLLGTLVRIKRQRKDKTGAYREPCELLDMKAKEEMSDLYIPQNTILQKKCLELSRTMLLKHKGAYESLGVLLKCEFTSDV